MKILIAITSCVKFALDGSHQACRDTYLTQLPQFPSIEYKFFMGDGTPTGEDETAMQASRKDCHHSRPMDDSAVTYAPKDDEVLLHVPDDYVYFSWKLRGYVRWAAEREYDYIFNAVADTYIDLERLMSSGFDKYDFSGRSLGRFPCGGSGYWLSKKTYNILLDKPCTDWTSDRWVGHILLNDDHAPKYGIKLHGDDRYSASPEQNYCTASEHRSPLFPEPNNEQITAHLSEAPSVYHNSLMYKAHNIRLGVPSERPVIVSDRHTFRRLSP